ncbi:MAG: EAL domain-containing protein, partial [Burkholderiales bacterium]
RSNALVLDGISGIAVNLSVASLAHPEISQFLRRALQDSQVAADKLILEITESAAIQNFDAAEGFIRDMRRFGVRFSLDDFGSGYTSYAHLKRLSVDTLKIDGSYIRDIDRSSGRSVADRDVAIVRSMADVAHTLGMKVVAEWVESIDLLAQLVDLGIDFAQGYAIHKPIRLSELVANTPEVSEQ